MTSGLVVSEVFGPTVQGEGPHAGRRCGFVRLGMCNLTCHWCDAAYTWDWSRFDRAVELHPMSVEEITAQVVGMGVDLVVVTGGEPLIQRRWLADLVGVLVMRGVNVEIETNGTLPPGESLIRDVSHWNISPKLAHAEAGPEGVRLKPDVLQAFRFARGAAFKFVVTSVADLDEVAGIVDSAGIPAHLVWIMAEGVTVARLADVGGKVADEAIARGWNITGRLHIDLWGDQRGR